MNKILAVHMVLNKIAFNCLLKRSTEAVVL